MATKELRTRNSVYETQYKNELEEWNGEVSIFDRDQIQQ